MPLDTNLLSRTSSLTHGDVGPHDRLLRREFNPHRTMVAAEDLGTDEGGWVGGGHL